MSYRLTLSLLIAAVLLGAACTFESSGEGVSVNGHPLSSADPVVEPVYRAPDEGLLSVRGMDDRSFELSFSGNGRQYSTTHEMLTNAATTALVAFETAMAAAQLPPQTAGNLQV
ncbi:hypothetical protein SH661x_004712 [Planctomicrobium sp. SH661]|uniref:hypothetical protein n=1 Tax=Planctomicrobium sp. SH661 TaxID=3448124 RepID=UPI003F5B1F30